MLVRSWFDSLKSRLTYTPNRHQRRAAGERRPATHHSKLETLEDRCLLAFAGAVNYPTGANSQAIVSADFNGDNVLDLAVANYSNSTVSVLIGNVNGLGEADGTFQPAVTSATGSFPLSLAVGDFNDDGNLDVATANAYDVSVMLGNGNGTFGTPSSMGVIGNPQSVAVGDFNGDGLLDLGVISNYYYSPPYNCYYYYYYPCYYYGYYQSYANVLLGNADGDGQADGTFSAANSTFLDYASHSTALAADLNGDAYDDFVSFNSNGYVTVLMGHGSGYLHGPALYYTGNYSNALAAGDLDNDGDTDLVTANYYSNSVGVLLGNGLGGFSAPVNFATGGSPVAVALGDFTHDGKLDVLAAISGAGQLIVLHGEGDGTFSLPAIAATVSSVRGTAEGDFNGDGWPDAATANGNSNASVLINDQSWPVPAPPNVTIKDVTKNEGRTGLTSFSFTVELSQASSLPVTVSFATLDGTARTSDNDYVAATGTITIAAGQLTETITIFVRGDKKKEASETFFVHLAGATNATITDAQGMGTISNDDGRGKGPRSSRTAAFLGEDSFATTKKRK
jgi:hypothetical protein